MIRSSHKFVIALSLVASTSGAQSTPEPSAGARDQLNQQALAAIRKGDFATAEAILITQWRLEKTARVACNLGQVYFQQQRWPQASRFLDSCLELAGSKAKASAKKAAADAAAKVYRLTITTTPADAEVKVDDEAQTEHDLYLTPGVHELVASSAGYGDERRILDGAAGTHDSLAISLKKLPPKAAPAAASVAPPPTAGAAQPPASEPADYTTRNIVVISAGALAAGALVGHLLFRSQASAKQDEWNSLGGEGACTAAANTRCNQATQVAADWDSARSTGDVFLGLGIGLAVTGVAALLLWPKPKPAKSGFVPVLNVGSEGSSLQLKGSF